MTILTYSPFNAYFNDWHCSKNNVKLNNQLELLCAFTVSVHPSTRVLTSLYTFFIVLKSWTSFCNVYNMCIFGHVWSPYLLTWDQWWSCDVLAWQKGHMVHTVNERLGKSQRHAVHVWCWCESQLSREGWKGSYGPLRWLYYLLCNAMLVLASYSNSIENLKGQC